MNRLLVSFALTLALVPSGTAFAATPTSISVTGSATVSMIPDQATVNASIVTTADSASQAVAENNRRYDAVVNAIARTGVKRDDISLAYYNVNYVPKPNPLPANSSPYDRWGYTVTRSFAVTVRAMDRAGAVVDAATASGATNIESVSFGLSKPDAARASATRKAVADARVKAEELAQAAGLHVTGIQSMQLEGAPVVRPMMMAKVAPAVPAPTEFDPGSVNVSANVTVIFSASP